MKKILIINGHPNPESFNFGIVAAYKKGALQNNAEVQEITIADLQFNPNLKFGYQKRTEQEPDLISAWEKFFGLTIWFGYILFGGADYPLLQKGLLIAYSCQDLLFNTVKIPFFGTNY